MASWHQRIDRWTARSLDVPNEQIQRMPRLTWVGQTQLYIEHYDQMVIFSEQLLKLKTAFGDLSISGLQLRISGLHEDEILVEGKILSVSYGSAN